MDRLARRLDRIERALGPDAGTCLHFPDGQGGFIEVPGCRTLADVIALAGVRTRRDDADGIRQNPTK